MTTLDRIVITEAALTAWHRIAMQMARTLAQDGYSLDDIPDEDAEVLVDGRLRIFVPGIAGATLIIAPTEWAWRT
jgi:hypothetical protein